MDDKGKTLSRAKPQLAVDVLQMVKVIGAVSSSSDQRISEMKYQSESSLISFPSAGTVLGPKPPIKK